MKKVYAIVSLILLSVFSFSQGEYNVWYFGNNAGMDFNGGAPVALTNGALNTNEGSSSISDAAGNLLLYTDGMSVWNRNHVTMPNGTGLHGNGSSIQAALVVKQPGSATIYYVFTTDNNANAYGMKYSIVDMTLNGGLGDVTSKNIPLITPSGEKLIAIPHSNCNDIWVLTHGYNNNTFFAYLLTSTGINPAITSNVGTAHNGGSAGAFNSALGAMKASPDGTKIAVCDQYSGVFEVVDFNAATGAVSNALSLSPLYRAFGTEFSEDGTKLYVTERQGSQMWQFDMSAGSSAAIQASKILITNAGSYNYGALQRGTDGKIYLARDAQTSLGVINSPNLAGASCNYVENGFNLAGRTCQEGLPTIAMMFTAPVLSVNDDTICDGQSATLTVSSTALGTTYQWNTGSTANPYVISPTTTTTYTVTGDAGGCTASTSAIVTVQAAINLNASATLLSICAGDTTDLSATSSILGTTYLWNNGLGAGANHSVSPIVNTSYIVTATSPLGCTEIDTIDIIVDTVINPTIIPLNPNICVGDSVSLTVSGGNNYLWDNGLTQSTITVSPAITTTYSVTATSISGCSGTASVDVTVNPAVNLNLSATNLQLCIGDSSLLIASSTDPGTTYLWSGGLGTNDSIILFPTNTNTYIVTATSSGGCVEIDSLTIQVDSNITVTINPTTAEICKGESVNILAGGGNNYLWNNGATQANITVNPTSTTNYSVTATSTAGCSGSATMTVTVYPGPIAVYFISPSPAGVNQTVQFTDASIGASSWDWDFGDGQTAIGLDPTHSYTAPGSYDTWLNVEDNHGCKDSTSVRIVINQLFTFYIPNSFSPDDNGVNDVFIPSGVNVDEDRYIMQVYDRWGKLVFETKDITKGWDGSINGKVIIVEETSSNVFSYYFHIYERYTDIDHEYRGHIILIK
jgi:gliding motility-associated-like protein